MQNTFTQKLINVDLGLVLGQFQQQGGTTGNNTKLTGLRTQVKLRSSAGPAMMEAIVAVYGLPLSLMNQCTTLGTQFDRYGKNTIKIEAGDSNGMTTVFTGHIMEAFVDALAMPQVCFRINAMAGFYDTVAPAQDTSYVGAVPFKTIMRDLAKKMNYTFEDATLQGFNPQLTNPHFTGSYRDQAIKASQAANAQFYLILDKLVIGKPGSARAGAPTLLSKDTGMIGYPTFASNSVIVRALWQPGLEMGKQITVQSDLTAANGTFVINSVEYDLESLTPHGQWMAVMTCLPANQTAEPSGE